MHVPVTHVKKCDTFEVTATRLVYVDVAIKSQVIMNKYYYLHSAQLT